MKVLNRKRPPPFAPEKKQRPAGPQTTLRGHIYCKTCARTYEWPPGSKQEARLYRVFLLDEGEKSFFCDAECYWDYTYPAPGADPAADQKEAARYGLPAGSGIDWDAKLKPPDERWDTDMVAEEGEADDGGELGMQEDDV